MNLKKLVNVLEKKYDPSFAEDWDNCGVQVGSYSRKAEKILVALEITGDVISEAVDGKYDVIITHHPMTRSGIKSINDFDVDSQFHFKLIQSNIAVYSLHTSLDSIKGGINDYLCDLIKLKNVVPLDESVSGDAPSGGLGRIGELERPMGIIEFSNYLKSSFSLENLRISNYKNSPHTPFSNEIQKIAVCSGSGMSLLDSVMKRGVDAFIAGDIKHHDYRRAESCGIILADIGHYQSENIYMKVLAHDVKKALNDSGISVNESTQIRKSYLTLF